MPKIETKTVIIGVSVAGLILGAFFLRKKLKDAAKGLINYAFSKEQEHYLSELNPKYQIVFRKWIADVESNLGYKVLITDGYRSFAESAKLKLDNPGNAAPGLSMHNYGVALDINLVSKKDGSIIKKASSDTAWRNTGIVKTAEKYGLKWGGGGAFGNYDDTVHFEIPFTGSKLLAQAIKQFGSQSKIIGNKLNIIS